MHFKILKEYKETKIQKELSTKYKMKKERNNIPAAIAFQRNLNHKSRMNKKGRMGQESCKANVQCISCTIQGQKCKLLQSVKMKF